MKINKTVKNYTNYQSEVFQRYHMGLEIQDLTNPNLIPSEIETMVDFYQNSLDDKVNQNLALHGPFVDLLPMSLDHKIAKYSIQKYRLALEVAAKLNVHYVIFHSQLNPWLKYDPLHKLIQKNYGIILKRLIDVTSYKGMILLENVFEDDPNDLRRLIEIIDHERIMVNLDLGHANKSGKPVEEWVHGLKDLIRYMHVHSNDGKVDRHLRPDNSFLLNLRKIIRDSKIDVVMSLEYETDNLEDEIARYYQIFEMDEMR